MTSFPSTEDFFQAVAALLARLVDAGHAKAADELREGLGCLNGLTDGWALFLKSVESVQSTYAKRLTQDEQRALEQIRAAAHQAVYRR